MLDSSSLELDHSPFVSLRHQILLCWRRHMVDKWKKEVFRSPKLDHWSRDFKAQNSSSRKRICWNWSVRDFSRSRRAEHGLRAIERWIPLRRASSLFFLKKILPNTSRFHVVTLSVKSLMAKITSFGKHCQESCTILGKLGSLNHMVSRRNGFFPKNQICWSSVYENGRVIWRHTG